MPKRAAHQRSKDLIKSFQLKVAKKRSTSIKLADFLTSTFGTMTFLTVNFVFFLAWIIVNSGRIAGLTPFDPFPYTLLTMIVSLEAIALSIVVLVSQNRQSQIDTLRDEMDLQVNLIAEREITKILSILREIHEKTVGKKVNDREIDEMIDEVDTSYIARELEKQLSQDQTSLISEITQPLVKATQKFESNLIENKKPLHFFRNRNSQKSQAVK